MGYFWQCWKWNKYYWSPWKPKAVHNTLVLELSLIRSILQILASGYAVSRHFCPALLERALDQYFDMYVCAESYKTQIFCVMPQSDSPKNYPFPPKKLCIGMRTILQDFCPVLTKSALSKSFYFQYFLRCLIGWYTGFWQWFWHPTYPTRCFTPLPFISKSQTNTNMIFASQNCGTCPCCEVYQFKNNLQLN